MLAGEGLQVRATDKSYAFVRVSQADTSFELVGHIDIEECLDDYVAHIESERRMAFWRKDAGTYRWRSRPERYAQDLLYLALRMRLRDGALVFEEIGAGAGRVDIYITTPIGESFIVELKMCGRGYSESYAQRGMEQLLHYMTNKNVTISYLIVLDSRLRGFAQGFNIGTTNVDGKSVITKVVDARPEVIGT